MDATRRLFVLAGNNPYDNRGCEAIARGTVAIIRSRFADPRFVAADVVQTRKQERRMKEMETDSAIEHLAIGIKRWSWLWAVRQVRKRFRIGDADAVPFRQALPAIDKCDAVLSVGGDNYSMDYGRPDIYVWLGELVLARRKPLVIWGASMGPFERDPDYDQVLVGHLKKVTGIFVRETVTYDYLRKRGIEENVRLVADPAFAMEPEEPPDDKKIDIPEGAIGFNQNPLISFYHEGRISGWLSLTAALLKEIRERLGRPIVLVPHVAWPNGDVARDDFTFLEAARRQSGLTDSEAVILPQGLSAAQTKWLIAKTEAFIGSRTHSTISAISCGIPTITIGYSYKGIGINQDVFGHAGFCIPHQQLTPQFLIERLEQALKQSKDIRLLLRRQVPKMRERALIAADFLTQIVEERKMKGCCP